MPDPDMMHRHIGNVQNFDADNYDTLTLLFEDQMTEKLGILHAATDDTITVLDIDWLEEGFADDFHATLDDAELRVHLDTLADLLRADPGSDTRRVSVDRAPRVGYRRNDMLVDPIISAMCHAKTMIMARRDRRGRDCWLVGQSSARRRGCVCR